MQHTSWNAPPGILKGLDDFTNAGGKDLITASKEGDTKIVQELCQKMISNITNYKEKDGKTALIHACAEGKTDIVDILLKYKADPNICSKFKFSPLYAAALNGCTQIVKKLVENQAEVNHQDEW